MIVLLAVSVAVVAALLWLRLRLVVVTVRGDSMAPTLRSGDQVLVRRKPLRAVPAGALVVFARPRTTEPGWMIKRVIAVPGDVIPRARVATLWSYPGNRVPAHQMVVLGDNPDESYDSRHFGYVEEQALLGVVHRVSRRAEHQRQGGS
ncbi:signal peptidase I [Actinophytocola oryzae]|uniref:Signal peptidase I n=1 Tax=Actinophytocola oryzae TaxID=502181 RepID=A0A4V6Q6Z4_9PSEU|nr:signal peptidase I [Actinophytocola oryzae]TDV56241.1 signal peptidase I [Actinophytocola oryzae]